jgi:hypothetical protein
MEKKNKHDSHGILIEKGKAMEKTLVNSHKYDGQYVAMVSRDNNTVVGAGKTPDEALNEAKENGYQNPLLLYVPEKGLVHIYYAG